jgi:hypothetical protein
MRRIMMTLCLLGALSTTAHAKDNTGRIGIGADTTLSAVNLGASVSGGSDDLFSPGLSAIYQANKAFGLQGILSFTNIASSADGSDAAATDIGIAVRARYGFWQRGDLNLNLVGGLAFESASVDDDAGDEVFSATNVLLEGGIHPEWFVSHYLSLQIGIGVSIDLTSVDNMGMGSADDTNFNLLGASELVGDAGFHFYF